MPWLPARPPPSTRNRIGQDNPAIRLVRVLDTRPCLAGSENLVGPLRSFFGVLPDLHAAEQDILAEQQATQAVFAGSPDRSVLYGVLAQMEMLGLDLVEVHRVTKIERYPAPRNPA